MSEVHLYNIKGFFLFSPLNPLKLSNKTSSPGEKAKVKRSDLSNPSVYSILSLISLSPSFPILNSSPCPFFLSKSHFSLMDVLSAGGFWFRLLTPSASPNIHFRCGGSITLISLKMKLWLNAPLLAVEGLRVSPLHMKEDAPSAWVGNDVRPVN